MTTAGSTRRRFFTHVGAALAAPLAAAGAADAAAAGDGESLGARLARLEDLEAIRVLNERCLRAVNAGDAAGLAALFADPRQARLDPRIRSLAVDWRGAPDAIEIAADRRAATARLARTAHTETPLEPCPLVEMALAQGEGVLRRSERGVLEARYVRLDGAWRIARVELRTG